MQESTSIIPAKTSNNRPKMLIFYNHVRLPVEGLGYKHRHITFNLKFVLPT